MTPEPTLPPGRAPGAAGIYGQLLTARCGCCQKTRTDPADIALFGALACAGGKTWDICGKCIQFLWRKRHPRPDKM